MAATETGGQGQEGSLRLAGSMIAEVVPTLAASAELFTDPPDVVLFEAELASVSRAVESRRLEFGTVRHCARKALSELGYPPVPLLKGERGEPLWPSGIVGSMTHCAGYRAAAVARAEDTFTLGIDAEPHQGLPDGVSGLVAFAEENAQLARLRAADDSVCWDRLLFSCKEAIYKAWFPLTGRWLGFEDVCVVIDPFDNTFLARLLVPGPILSGEPRQVLAGRWLVRDGLILTATGIPIDS